MKNIKKIYRRFTDALVRSRALIMLVVVQNTTLTLLTIVFANVIISKGRINGELDYEQIKLFYNLMTYILYFLAFIYTPFFLASALNKLVNNNTLEYLLSVKMQIKEITYAAFLRGFANVFILVVTAFPIACVSLYFGGIGILRIIRILICLFSFIMLLSSMCLYISSLYKEQNVTLLIGYIICFTIFVIHIAFLKYIVNISIVTFLYFIFIFIISLCFIILAYKGKVFND